MIWVRSFCSMIPTATFFTPQLFTTIPTWAPAAHKGHWEEAYSLTHSVNHCPLITLQNACRLHKLLIQCLGMDEQDLNMSVIVNNWLMAQSDFPAFQRGHSIRSSCQEKPLPSFTVRADFGELLIGNFHVDQQLLTRLSVIMFTL